MEEESAVAPDDAGSGTFITREEFEALKQQPEVIVQRAEAKIGTILAFCFKQALMIRMHTVELQLQLSSLRAKAEMDLVNSGIMKILCFPCTNASVCELVPVAPLM